MQEVAVRKGESQVHFERPIPNHVLLFRGQTFPIKTIKISVKCVDSVADIEMKKMLIKNGEGGVSPFRYGEARVGKKLVKVLIPFGESFERAVIKVLDDSEPRPSPADDPDFIGEVWHWESGRWKSG